MNSTLLPNSYGVDYSLHPDNKFLGQARTFTDPTSISSSEFAFINRKPQHALSNIPLGQLQSVPTSAGLNYNSHQPIQEHPYSGSASLVSPPSSIDGSQTVGLPSTPSSFNFSDTSKLVTSNASSTNPFTPSITHYPVSPWNETTMTDLRNGRPSVLHPQMSPSLSYGHPGSVASQYLNHSNRAMNQYAGSYSASRPFNGPEMSSGIFDRHRNQSFNQLPVPTGLIYPPYPQMPPQQPGKPEGPPFEETKVLHHLITNRNQQLSPDITASIQKGFFQVDGKWTCYRRNYFTVSCGFSFKCGLLPDDQIYIQENSQHEAVTHFAVSISAKTANSSSQESETRHLVQHTPKRDKATESVPGRHRVIPAPAQSLTPDGLSASTLYQGGSNGLGYDAYGMHNQASLPTSHTFERIQFQKATANNGKRRAQQQYFHVVVELSASVCRPSGEDHWILIATRQSHPMVVRGRSPGHYRDNRRDSQTNMDPDPGHGPASDGHQSSLRMPPPFLGGNQSNPMDWAPLHRQGNHYGNTYSRLPYETNRSPQSASSSTSMTESPTESDFQLGDASSPRLSSPYGFDRPGLSPMCGEPSDFTIGHGQQSCEKQSLDGEDRTYDHDYYSNTSNIGEGFSPRSFELNSPPSAKPLCASS